MAEINFIFRILRYVGHQLKTVYKKMVLKMSTKESCNNEEKTTHL